VGHPRIPQRNALILINDNQSAAGGIEGRRA
jgi:hypothetical protein